MPKQILYSNTGFNLITQAKVRTTLQNMLGSNVRIQHVKESTLNLCYRVKAPGINAILKISPLWYNRSLRREVWCYDRLNKKTKLDIPKILFFLDNKNDFFKGHELLLLEHIKGRPLSTRDFQNRDTNMKTGKIFKAIHGLSAVNYGFLSEKFTGEHKTWRSFLLDMENVDSAVKSGYLKPSDLHWLKKNMNLISLPDSHCLLYGDFNPSNFISSPGRGIVALDFQSCFAGNSLYDIGSGLYNIPQLLDHLDCYCKNSSSSKVRSAILIYAMRRAVSVMSHRSSIGDRRHALKAKKRFETLKRSYLDFNPETT